MATRTEEQLKKDLEKIDISEYNLENLEMDDIFDLELQQDLKFKLVIEKAKLNNIKRKKVDLTYDELFKIVFEKWQESKLSDDLVFYLFMEDVQICHKILNILLKSQKIDVENIERIERQKVVDLGFDSKGVRFDVHIKGDDKVYVIEMQTGTSKEIFDRMLFYSSILINKQLLKGQNYNKLTETYLIFICTDDDPLKQKQCETMLQMCALNNKTEEWSPIKAKLKWLIFSVDNYENIIDNEELKSFFLYLKGKPREDKITNIIHTRYMEVKNSKKLEVNCMMQQIRDMEKLEIGRKEGVEELIKNLLESFTPEIVSSSTKISLEEVLRIKKQYSV